MNKAGMSKNGRVFLTYTEEYFFTADVYGEKYNQDNKRYMIIERKKME